MARLRWVGPPPETALKRALELENHELVHPRTRDVDGVVVYTPSVRQLPGPPEEGLPWIWACGTEISQAAACEAARRGAYDSLAIHEREGQRRLLDRILEFLAPPEPPPEASSFVAESPAARRVLAQLARVAATSMPVLVTGETGTGKEVTARLLHRISQRRTKRFVPINCAAIPNELMEAELFGYSKGAFSGAVQAFDGQLMAAEGGTVFLDEIDDTPLSTQVKLLRVLEDRVVQRLGQSEPHRVDFRIIAATNRDLRPLIASGAFGADFYERLAIVTIQLPPLRERLADLPALVRHFLGRFHAEEPAANARPPVVDVAPAALAALVAYPWPGNIRELRNVLFEALVYKRAGTELLLSDLPRRVLQGPDDGAGTREPGARGAFNREVLERKLATGAFDLVVEVERLERLALELALAQAGGSPVEASRLLGRVGRGASKAPGDTVRAMMRRLGVRGGGKKG